MNNLFKISIILFMVFFLSVPSLKANNNKSYETVEQLQEEFLSFGGSEYGFNKIVKYIEKTQSYDEALQKRIQAYYDPQLQKAMRSKKFDEKLFQAVLDQVNKEKAMLVKTNMDNMISMLKGLKPRDRKAYSEVLYGTKQRVIPSSVSNTPNLQQNNVDNKDKEQKANDKNSEDSKPSVNKSSANSINKNNSGGTVNLDDIETENTKKNVPTSKNKNSVINKSSNQNINTLLKKSVPMKTSSNPEVKLNK